MRPRKIAHWLRTDGLQPLRWLATPVMMHQAARNRDRFAPRFIAVAGSCGKSTTTMVAHRLIAAQATAALGLHSNTLKGARDSLRKLRRPVDYLVQEVSEAPIGTLAAVARLIRPHAAIITSIGLDHQTLFHSRENVAAELGVLTATLAPEAVLCVSAEEPLARALAAESAARTVLFGLSAEADVRAVNVEPSLPGRLRFDLVAGDRTISVRTRFAGTVMLNNLLGALALVHGLGLDLDQAAADLAEIEPLPDRLGIVEGRDGHIYVLDDYKAPFWSTEKLVTDLPNLAPGRRVFVLGEMSDLGPNQGSKYRRVLRHASDNADLVFAIGPAASSAERLVSIDKHRTNVRAIDNLGDIGRALDRLEPSVVVIKGNGLDSSLLLSRPVRALEPA